MRAKRQTIEDTDGERCSGFMPNLGCSVCLQKLVAIPSHLATQVTAGVWNAVVTTLDRGTFLIRRPMNLSANACSLRAYEIHHIEAVSPPVSQRAGWGSGTKR